MTLDELLLEWSYRSDRGYPSVDNPSDVSTLKQILKELNLSEQDVDDILDNLPDKAGGDDLTHQGTDGMEDSSVEAEKEKQYQDKFDKETKKQSEEEQDLISIIDDNQEPILNLSPEELERLSQKINTADELNEDFDGGDLDIFVGQFVKQTRKAGVITTFPTHLIHQVSEVTRGSRKALITFANGKDLEKDIYI